MMAKGRRGFSDCAFAGTDGHLRHGPSPFETQIADGKVVEDWANPDMLGFMQQIGFELAPAKK